MLRTVRWSGAQKVAQIRARMARKLKVFRCLKRGAGRFCRICAHKFERLYRPETKPGTRDILAPALVVSSLAVVPLGYIFCPPPTPFRGFRVSSTARSALLYFGMWLNCGVSAGRKNLN